MKWEAWEKLKGQSKETCQKLFIIRVNQLLEEEGLAHKIPNPYKPGPNYYSECKMYDWVTELKASH